MRNTILVATVLGVLGLVPIGGWLAFAANLDPAGLGRAIGRALLVLFSPMPVGGLLMIGAAVFLGRGGTAARVVATVGTALVSLGLLAIVAAWIQRILRCGPAGARTEDLIAILALIAYLALHAGLIASVWRLPR